MLSVLGNHCLDVGAAKYRVYSGKLVRVPPFPSTPSSTNGRIELDGHYHGLVQKKLKPILQSIGPGLGQVCDSGRGFSTLNRGLDRFSTLQTNS